MVMCGGIVSSRLLLLVCMLLQVFGSRWTACAFTFTIPITMTRHKASVLYDALPPFSKTSATRTRSSSSSSSSTTTTTTVSMVAAPEEVSRVAVCTGHLCECQEEEGGNGSDILQKLKDLNMDCDVDDAPCLGCCGMGAMVWIEYKDGSDQIVAGMEETMEGLGLSTGAAATN
mmetsp:Transcript_29141/g.41005  ORF Transcript_29141/g.41005 Transcript_29141/m.41005 type:complete len:173 (-) Transcript_29141:318-836(-)